MDNGSGPLIAIPRWKAPTWERTGYYMDSVEAAAGRCRLIEEKKLPKDAGGLLLMGVIGVVAALVLARVDALRRLLIPRDRMSAHVDQAAAATFTEEKITLTKDRNAVLLYISVFEGEVRLLPDIGVEQRVEASALGEIQADLANAPGDATAQIVEALERLGKCCAGAFPIQADDENELPDRPQIRMP